MCRVMWQCAFFCFKQKTAYEMPISDWSSDVCSSDLFAAQIGGRADTVRRVKVVGHADRIGSRERIYRRSLARAEAVAEVFVASGVDPARIVIVAKGAAESLTACCEPQPRPALLACLAPDRPVTGDVATAPRE